MDFIGYLDFWFSELPLVARVARFAALGIRRLNVWSWRVAPIADLVTECRRNGVQLSETYDDRGGSLVDAADLPRCLDAWRESLEMAERYGISHLYMFSDEIGPGPCANPLSRAYSPEEKYANLLDGAARVMELVEKTTVKVWFEAINTYYVRGVTVNRHDLAADVVRRINHPQLRMAFDCFHQQSVGGNLILGLEAYAGLYTTIHVGDVPTRQEPGTGEINFLNLARKLRHLRYAGPIGLEFYPSGREADALAAVQGIFEPPIG